MTSTCTESLKWVGLLLTVLTLGCGHACLSTFVARCTYVVDDSLAAPSLLVCRERPHGPGFQEISRHAPDPKWTLPGLLVSKRAMSRGCLSTETEGRIAETDASETRYPRKGRSL